ncbi:MAG: DNA polymerase III subunit delta', partial [Bacteroidia bacterium]|nr:DNA polymerase III subunit delta' [Bacteroidia bacterium]
MLYQTVTRALVKQQLSHAYLLVGEAGTPLLKIALFLAKSLVCEHPDP